MREIKFKIYDKFNQNTCEVVDIDFKKRKVTGLFRGFLPNTFDFDDVELLQYVGLQDINNSEIYENDVLYNGSDSCIVTFDSQKACFVGKFKNKAQYLDDLIKNGYYIVQNYYDDKNNASP